MRKKPPLYQIMANQSLINLSQTVKENLTNLGNFAVKKLAFELQQQGHKATGSLINSLSYKVAFEAGELSLLIYYNNYGAVINNGVAANRVPFGRGGGAKSAYIQGLLGWVQLKITKDPKKALGITFAIAKTHKEKGVPTTGSYKFSKNGRRLGFQDFTIAEYSDEIIAILQNNLEQPFFIAVDSISDNLTV